MTMFKLTFATTYGSLPVWILAVLGFCLIFSKISYKIFHLAKERKYQPPLVPNSVPVLGHGLLFLTQQARLASICKASSQSPVVRFKVPFNDIWLAKGAPQIRRILCDPTIFDFEPMKSLALKRILGLRQKVIDVANRDDSGVNRKPISTTRTPAEKRFNYMEREATRDFLRPASHHELLRMFESNLYHEIENCGAGTNWSESSDFFQFIRHILFRATTDAFYGPHLLQVMPQLEKDLWEFDNNVPYHAKGLPSILNWQAGRIRARCIQAFRTWRSFALNQRAELLPEWNEMSGLKANTLRKEVFDKFDEWDDNSCAASDLAVLFGLTSNSIRATFWFFVETLRSTDLARDASTEINSVIRMREDHQKMSDLPRFDLKALTRLPLLQSLYAETLRMYVSVMMVRTTRQSCTLGDWKVTKGQQVMVCNYSQHMKEENWNPNGTVLPPPDVFWGRRFLSTLVTAAECSEPSSKNSQTVVGDTKSQGDALKFTGEGLGTRFLPFGMGERMCPGRHFAKLQTLLAFALIVKAFDVELLIKDDWNPSPDWKHFGYGTMPPTKSIPFRIRRKAHCTP